MRKLLLLAAAVVTLAVGTATAQILKPVKWKISVKKVSEGIYDVVCEATIEPHWHLYDTKLPENGPLPTTFNLEEDETDGIELVGAFKATTKPKIEDSDVFQMELAYFENKVTMVQRIKLTKPKAKLVGYVEFMACNDGQCIPPAEEEFSFELEK